MKPRLSLLCSCGAFILPSAYAFVAAPLVAERPRLPYSISVDVIRWAPCASPKKQTQTRLAAMDGESSGAGAGGDAAASRENPFGAVAGDDWYMNTARMRYLREMEKLGQEMHNLVNGGGASPLDPTAGLLMTGLGMPSPPSALTSSIPDPALLASQEEMRRMEIKVAESCAQNWREEPLYNKPIGFVPGNRKVQQVKLCNKRVMYGSDNGFVGVANTVDGKDIFRQQTHSALVTALDYDISTGWMISAADDGVIAVYRETTERIEQIHSLRLHTNRVVAAEVLDHRLGMTASVDGKILVFELDTGRITHEIWASDTLLGVSVCKGYIFVGLMSGVCEAFSIRNGGRSAFRYIAQRCPIRSIKTFPTANHIKVVVGGQDGYVRQFQVRSVMSTELWKIPQDRSFDDRLVLMCNTHVDHETREVDQGFLLKAHKAPVVAVACDEEKVVSASEDGAVIVWDAFKGTPMYSIRKHVDGDLISAVDFNERYLVADGTKGKVIVWDYAHGPPPRRASRRAGSSRGGAGGPNTGGGKRGGGGGGLPGGSPFIGGWNLGHGPSDLGGLDGQKGDGSAGDDGGRGGGGRRGGGGWGGGPGRGGGGGRR